MADPQAWDRAAIMAVLGQSSPRVPVRVLGGLLAGQRPSRLEPGEDLDEKIPGDDIALVLSGGVGAGFKDLSGRLHLPRFFLQASLLREQYWLTPERRITSKSPSIFPESHHWVAMVPTDLVLLRGKAYLRALRHPAFARAVAWRLQVEMLVGNTFLKIHASQDKKIVLARSLVMLAEHLGWLQMGKVCLDINQNLIANFSCLSLRYVNGCLSRWSASGMLERHKGGLTILDDGALIREARLNILCHELCTNLRNPGMRNLGPGQVIRTGAQKPDDQPYRTYHQGR